MERVVGALPGRGKVARKRFADNPCQPIDLAAVWDMSQSHYPMFFNLQYTHTLSIKPQHFFVHVIISKLSNSSMGNYMILHVSPLLGQSLQCCRTKVPG